MITLIQSQDYSLLNLFRSDALTKEEAIGLSWFFWTLFSYWLFYELLYCPQGKKPTNYDNGYNSVLNQLFFQNPEKKSLTLCTLLELYSSTIIIIMLSFKIHWLTMVHTCIRSKCCTWTCMCTLHWWEQ